MPTRRVLPKRTGSLTTMGPSDFTAYRESSYRTRRGYKVKPMSCQRWGANEQRNLLPLVEFLIDGHHLDVLVLLHLVPRGGIGLGPNDYTAGAVQKKNRGRDDVANRGSPCGPRARRVRYHPQPITVAPTTQ
jgi:hypothetical protein